MEAVRFGRGIWIGRMSMCWGSLGGRMLIWGYLRSCQMWKAITWRIVWKEWDQEMETKPKLEMLKRIVRLGEWSECARVVRGWTGG